MAVSKKHYEALARTVSKNWGKTIGKDSTILADLCDILASDNRNFDRAKFVSACAQKYREGDSNRG